MAEKWYNVTPEEAAKMLNTDLLRGLDEKSVRARLEKFGKNDVFLTPGASFSSCVRAAARDVSSYLLIILALMAAVFKQNVSAVVVVLMIVINFILTLLVYSKSQKVLRDMASYAAPMSRVIRGGKLMAVRQSSLVVGDIVLVASGDIIPADARIVESRGLYVLESELGGDAKSRRKSSATVYGANVPMGERTNMVFATSLVTAGSAKILLCACGNDTFAAATGKKREIVQHNDLKVLKTLKKCCSVWSLCMIVLIFVVTGVDLALGLESRGLFNIFITGASLSCAAMTEFYVLFAYFIIGSGLFGTLKKSGPVNAGAVIKKISTLEEIKGIDTLIVPKRGGFYTDHSSLERIFCSDTLYRANEKNLYNHCGRAIKFALLSSGYAANPSVFDDLASEPSAIVTRAERIGIDRKVLAADYPLLFSGSGFDGINADCAIVAGAGNYIAIVRGEAAPILEHCTSYRNEDGFKPINERARKHINDALRAIDEEGCRAVAVITMETEATDFSALDTDGWRLEGILGISEPSLPDAEFNIRACMDAGINVIALADTERDPSRIYFKRIGLVADDSEIMTSSRLSEMGEEAFAAGTGTYKMYEGLTISQKRMLVGKMRHEGHVVGVLGRDLDDVLMLSDADVGFSTGVTLSERAAALDIGGRDSTMFAKNEMENTSGCEALKYTCDVLVSPPESPRGGFNAMVKTLCTAKIIYQNLLRMVKYLFTSQIARLVMVVYSVVVRNVWPLFSGAEFLTPAQILFLGLIVDFGVVVAIGFQRAPDDILTERENTEERLERPFVYNFIKPLAFGLFWGLSAIAAPLILSLTGTELSGAPLTSMVFISFILTQLIVACEVLYEDSLFAMRGHRINRTMLVMWLAAAVFIAVGAFVPAFGKLFSMTMLTPVEWGCTLIVPVLMTAAYEIYKLIRK